MEMNVLIGNEKLLKRVIIATWIISLIILEMSSFGERGILNCCKNFKIFDMRLNYNANSVYSSLKRLPEKGILHYKIYLIVDGVMTIAFAGIQYLLADYIGNNNNVKRILNSLLVVRMFCDLIENTCIMFVLNLLPMECIKTITFSSIVTKIKFIALSGFIIFFIGLYTRNLFKKVKNNFKLKKIALEGK